MTRNEIFTLDLIRPTLDELLAQISGWDMDLKVMSASQRHELLKQVHSPEILVGQANFSSKVIQKGAAPTGYITFAILGEACLSINWKGGSVTQNSMILKPRSNQFDAISPAGFHVYTISIAHQLLEKTIEQQLHCQIEQLLHPEGAVIQLTTLQAAQIRRLVKDYFQRQIYDVRSLNEFKQAFLSLLIQVIDRHEPRVLRVNMSKRKLLVRQLLDQLCSQPLITNSLNELRTSLAVSPRTLEYACKEELGLSPNQLFKNLKLNAVMRDIRSKEGLPSIASIAEMHGFQHAGQFAKDYHSLFGEKPSETANQQFI